MGLPWIRLDAGLPSHDKTLRALTMPGGKAAMAVMQFAVEWSGGHGTDGHIPAIALPMIHATRKDIAVLVAVGFWDEDPNGDGWWIHNFARRQELAEITEIKNAQAAAAGRKSGCRRRGHPANCTCWQRPAGGPPIRAVT
ncbi:MAG: hypothetical protein WCF04_02220 [Candidatus Nanopelagicales bacterium]